MTKLLLAALLVMAAPFSLWAEKPTVNVEPPHLSGPRPLDQRTADAVIRDYLQSWEVLRTALDQNRPALIADDFVGDALDKLTDTMHQQSVLGLHTRYRDRSHDLRIVFYSPEGLSVQLVDNVEYDEQVLDHHKVLTTQRVRARYIIVMTPAETSWRVRVFQSVPE